MSDSIMFQPLKIGNVMIKNRFMRSPCYMNGCNDNDGLPEPWLLKYYRDLAEGGFGIITTGFMHTQLEGKILPNQAGLMNDAQANAWKDTVDFAHKHDAKFVFQLVDGGVVSPDTWTHKTPRGCSQEGPNTREMTKAEIAEVTENFVKAAVRAQNVGADGIEIHGAHGLLFSRFFSPLLNRRTDEYRYKNNTRFLQETVDAMRRELTNKDFLIGLKINWNDFVPGGMTEKEFEPTVRKITGVDFMEISNGVQGFKTSCRSTMIDKKNYPPSVGYNMPGVKAARRANPDLVISVCGGFRKLKDMEQAIRDGATMIGLGRPSISDTAAVNHLREGKSSNCVSCGLCAVKCLETGVHCYIYNKKFDKNVY